jgi:DNA (cytosine-5)-methyltransferase 1
MFFEAVRIIKEMRDATNSIYPRATIWENVPGALSSNKGADFGVVLSSLADIGAITQEYAVLDAQYFGIPQRRRRIFLVSIFDSAASKRCPDPLLPLIQGSRRDYAKSRQARQNLARSSETSTNSSNGQGFRLLAFGHYTNDDSASTVQARDHKYVTDIIVPNILDDIETVGTLTAGIHKGPRGTEAIDSNHIFAVSNPSVSPPGLAVRRLTPLECERLMGWPDDHTRWTADGKEQADTNRYKQCGNGVASPVAKWVGEQLRPVLETT